MLLPGQNAGGSLVACSTRDDIVLGVAERHIVALGGGGFSDEDPVLDKYVLDLAGTDRAKICFIPTASGDNTEYVAKFYRAFVAAGAYPSDLTLFSRKIRDIREFLLSQDVIYVGGGNTLNMLAIWRAHAVDGVLREAWERGIVLAGISAGGMCWFEAGVTDSLGRDMAGMRDGLALLDGSFSPHYSKEEHRRPRFHQLVAEGFPPGYGVDDFAALRFSGTGLEEIVASRADAEVYRVERDEEGRAQEVQLDVKRL